MSLFAGFYAIWISVHLLGLTAAWFVRMYAGHRLEGLAAITFFACLPLIAIATVIGQNVCLALWPLSACTLAVMIVTATVDLGSGESMLPAGDASK